MIYVLLWWLMVELLGWAAFPIAFWALRWLPDRGYAFSKAIGLLLASYLLWLGASVGLLRNEPIGILFSILLVLVFSAWLYTKKLRPAAGTPGHPLPDFLRQNKKLVLCVEILFALALVGWAILRAYAPDKVMNAGGEKFMEMAFLNGTLNSPTFPPLDPWLSGFSISYYYFGYVMMALLTRITGAPPGIGFDLYDALLFALTAVGVFGVVYNLVAAGSQNREGKGTFVKRQPLAYGFLGALLVTVMGNLEGLLETVRSKGILPESFWRWIDIPDLLNSPVTGSWLPGSANNWWWWRASRVIQDRDLLGQPMGISPITEFPFFSFLLGDNHPHVLALPFVLLMIALAFNLLRGRFKAQPGDAQATWWNPIQFAMEGDWMLFVFYALCLGSLGFLNTWDMPIYLGLVVLAFGAGEYTRRKSTSERKTLETEEYFRWELLRRMLVLGVSLLAAAILGYILFYISFSSQAGGVLPYVFPPTRLPQYLVMFGTFIFIITWFLLVSLIRLARQAGRRAIWQAALAVWGWLLLACVAVFLLVPLITLALTGWGSKLLSEIPLLQSILGGSDIAQALQRSLIFRLTNPWLFLALTLLIALSITNILHSIRRETGQNGTSVESDAPQATIHPINTSQLFAFLLVFLGLALTLSVEFFYLRDSFNVRMNTIFKFYFQAWVMLGCASAFGIWWLLNEAKPVLNVVARTIFVVGCTLLITAGLVYPLMASYSRVNGFTSLPNLDGTSSLAKNNPDDFAAIEWLRSNTENTPVILEAPGKSYSYEGRISAFSGLPSVLGWSLHEAQWRGNYDEQGKREPDIEAIYTTRDPQQALELLDKWKVKYVVVGPSEINYIQQLCNDPSRVCNLARSLAKFNIILTPVFQQGNVTIYRVP